MSSVYRAHPELREWIDRVLTADDYRASKPEPDCFLAGAKCFGAEPANCVVFEDSINGLRAGRAAGCFVVGLTTTNPPQIVRQYADCVVDDFTQLSIDKIASAINNIRNKAVPQHVST
jgi:beta-phosphoglucomutase-like phosphatase (HAD superfamily)